MPSQTTEPPAQSSIRNGESSNFPVFPQTARLDADVLNGCSRVTSTAVSTCRIEADLSRSIPGVKDDKPRFVGPPEAAFHKFVACAPKRTDTELDFLKGAL